MLTVHPLRPFRIPCGQSGAGIVPSAIPAGFRQAAIPAPSLVMRSPERLPFPECRPSSEDDGSRRRSPCRPEPSRTGPEG